jgi:hypothetical protein
MTLSAHCDYVSSGSIQWSWTITLSIQFIDSEWIPAEFTGSWTAIELIDQFNSVIPNYWGIWISYNNPVAFSLSEYQALTGYSDDGNTIETLSFIQSNCIDLPVAWSISATSSATPVLMDYQLFHETTLVEMWAAWFVLLVSTLIVLFKTFKYGILKN